MECCVEITEEETVEDLKTAVERELQIPVANQRLILKGKTLQDSSSIKEISVKDGDKVRSMLFFMALISFSNILLYMIW